MKWHNNSTELIHVYTARPLLTWYVEDLLSWAAMKCRPLAFCGLSATDLWNWYSLSGKKICFVSSVENSCELVLNSQMVPLNHYFITKNIHFLITQKIHLEVLYCINVSLSFFYCYSNAMSFFKGTYNLHSETSKEKFWK